MIWPEVQVLQRSGGETLRMARPERLRKASACHGDLGSCCLAWLVLAFLREAAAEAPPTLLDPNHKA